MEEIALTVLQDESDPGFVYLILSLQKCRTKLTFTECCLNPAISFTAFGTYPLALEFAKFVIIRVGGLVHALH